jgi:hypothetical protein
MVCVRRAWLILGDRRLELEDDTAGYYCTELDLGYPEVREVMNNRPDLDGADDRTALFGARAVSANIRARAGGTMTADEIGTLFAPFMLPGVRPELHYVLDRPGAPERMAAVRASGYTWPVSGARSREIHLGWIAADPAMSDPAERWVIAYAGSSTGTGRNYPLTFNRLYPPGGNTSTTATISSPGDIPIRPLLRIYGPITAPRVALAISDGSSLEVRFVAGFIINAGHWVDVDAANRTVYADSDPTLPVVDRVDWQTSTWPVLPVAPASTSMNLYGDSTAGVTQVEAIWHDRYIT